ncbi:hypothetical protein U5B43_04405 [Campylobacter sp. 9BO]|uniref:hypothetical protein n=1 Tax=Campylobacter sp. 9BO TaxID=3424759 RepID=UPI003D329A72
MKFTYSDGIVVLRPVGFLDLANDDWLDDEDVALIVAKNTKCMLLSLKEVVLFSPGWMTFVIDKLKNLAKQHDISVAICDYMGGMHDFLIKSCAKFINFSLFASEDLARLFYSQKFYDVKSGEILLYNDRIEQREFVASRLSELGYEFGSCSDRDEFLAKSKNAKYIVDSTTHLTMGHLDFKVCFKDEVVIYKINGMIDTEFINKFDTTYHEQLLICGYEYFVFWVNMSVGLNAHGANFVIKLAKNTYQYGGLVCICGVKEQNMSIELVMSLYSSGILLYQNIGDFFNDDTILYRSKNDTHEFLVRNVTKNIIDILPSVMSTVANVFVPFYKDQVFLANTKISTLPVFEIEMVFGCAVFYEELGMRLLVGIKLEKMQTICGFFGENSSEKSSIVSSYAKIFSIITDKILYFLMSKGIKAKLCMPRIFIQNFFYDDKTKGALSTIKSADDELGVIFLSR